MDASLETPYTLMPGGNYCKKYRDVYTNLLVLDMRILPDPCLLGARPPELVFDCRDGTERDTRPPRELLTTIETPAAPPTRRVICDSSRTYWT